MPSGKIPMPWLKSHSSASDSCVFDFGFSGFDFMISKLILELKRPIVRERFALKIFFQLPICKQTRFELFFDLILVGILPDEHDLIESVSILFVPFAFNLLLVFEIGSIADSLSKRHRCPPYSHRIGFQASSCLRPGDSLIFS